MNIDKKSKGVAYVLLWFLGLLGGYHFYLRQYTLGVLYMFTGAFLGIGWDFRSLHPA